ncbi:uncharacterized protein LOC121370282 [Gigantopelta aegis]|uniref:uncharacterized protein LOC121370282 n=1 Tax=Gigantopelta aegis TaxID=1735272 RepID=UPI001B887B30|nr:uncharacterized protein LOC121370282 [Gigantopelta aegis]XP_041351353.1 uncharacterized protein LOC121370282 [Gigantopelta aegis]
MEVDNDDVDHPFIGRAYFLNSLRDAWRKYRVFGIFGQKSVGKSRTVNEFLKRLQSDVGDGDGDVGSLMISSVDLQGVTSMETLRLKILLLLGFINEVRNDADDWVLQMCNKINTDITHAYILSFDNAEDCLNHTTMKSEFVATCSMIIKNCQNTRIIFSSTTKIAHGFPFFFWQELPPMNITDGSKLVKSIAPDADFGEYLEKIVELCCGLPLVLTIAGCELGQPEGISFTPAEMVDILSQCRLRALSSESYASEEQVGSVYRKFIERLTSEFQQRLAVLGYIPGSFTDVEASQLLAHHTTNETRKETLRPLLRRYMIEFQPKTRRYNIHGILQDCLEVYFNIENLAEVRKRYCITFSRILRELSSHSETAEYMKAYAVFIQEYPNLQKLLTDVMHSTEEMFPFYIEMAATSSNLIIEFFGNESILFFTKCFELAQLYGKQKDRALAMTHYGRTLTNVKSDFVGGRKMLTEAVNILELSPPTESLATVLLSLGWTVYLQGDIPQAIKHFSRGLEVVKEAECGDSLVLYRHLNCLGISHNLEGNLQIAEEYMFAALKGYIRKLGHDHPLLGSINNNIGLIMASKRDSERAREYFERGLEIKQKTNAPLKAIIASQNTVADTYIQLGNHQEAKIMLEAALASLDFAPELYSHERGLTLDTLGKVYLNQKNYEDAIVSFQKAVNIRKITNKGCILHVESLINLGCAYKGAGAQTEALKLFEEAVTFESKVYKFKTDGLRMYTCYREMIDIFTNLGDVQKVREAYGKASVQLTAMIDLYQANDLPQPVKMCQKHLAQLKESEQANVLLHNLNDPASPARLQSSPCDDIWLLLCH